MPDEGSRVERVRTAEVIGALSLATELAAADAYHAMTEPRPHRGSLPPGEAAKLLGAEASAGRLDPDAVTAVLTRPVSARRGSSARRG